MLNLFLVFFGREGGGGAIQDIEPPIKRQVRHVVVCERGQDAASASNPTQPRLRGLVCIAAICKKNKYK